MASPSVSLVAPPCWLLAQCSHQATGHAPSARTSPSAARTSHPPSPTQPRSRPRPRRQQEQHQDLVRRAIPGAPASMPCPFQVDTTQTLSHSGAGSPSRQEPPAKSSIRNPFPPASSSDPLPAFPRDSPTFFFPSSSASSFASSFSSSLYLAAPRKRTATRRCLRQQGDGDEDDDCVRTHSSDELDEMTDAASPMPPSSSSTPRPPRRPRGRPRQSKGRTSSLFSALVSAAATAAVLMVFLAPSLVRANTLSQDRHPSFGLSPRELSKRALPATYRDFMRSLEKRATVADITSEHQVDINLSQPATCSTLNITWDPTKGTPPFTLAVFVELWFPITVVTIPATYADPDLSLWLYQVDLPQFQSGPPAVGNTPSVFASIIDSAGQMANTSAFLKVDNSNVSCARDSTPLEFSSWSTGGPVQCQGWALGWNLSTPEFVGPLVGIILPERQPPLLLSPPENVILYADGVGGMNWTVTVSAGTYIMYSMTDGGTEGSGGMGGKSLVESSQSAGTDCVNNNPIGLASPTTTAEKMTITPDYSTAIVTTVSGVVSTIHTTIHQGGGSGSSFTTGSIIGTALGIGAAAGIVTALLFFIFYRRREKRRETRWEMPSGGSDYPKGMPVDRRFAGLSKSRFVKKKNTDEAPANTTSQSIPPGEGVDMNGDTQALRASFRRGRSLHGSFRSLSSSAYDARVDGSRSDTGTPNSSPPTPARLIIGNTPWSDDSLRSAESTQYGPFSSIRSRIDRSGGTGTNEREVLIVTNQSPTSPTDAFHKHGSIGSSSRGGSSNLASAYRTVLCTAGDSTEAPYEEVQLHDRRPSGGSSNVGREMLYPSSSAGRSDSHSSSHYASSPHSPVGSQFSRVSSVRTSRGNASRDDEAVPPLPAFPEAYRPSPNSSTIDSQLANSTAAATHRSGNVVIHADAGLLMDDRLSDDDEPGHGGDLLELPPQYASLPVRAHSSAGGGGASAARHDSGDQTLSANASASAGRNGQRGGAVRGRGRRTGGDEKESHEQGTVLSTAEDPFQTAEAEQTSPLATRSRSETRAAPADTSGGGARGRIGTRDYLEDDDLRSADRGTLDAFVGDENDDAFWLR